MAPKTTSKNTRILLVDDEQAVQKLLSYPLEKEGYEVVPATDGQQAIDSLRKRQASTWSCST